MDNLTTIQLRVPRQDLVTLTYDATTPKKMAVWIESLPMVNVGESSRQLYGAIQELNRYKTDAKTRFELLEQMRSSIHYVGKSLGKHFLNQSIILDEKQSKIANLAQALQNHLATGYKIVLLDTLKMKTSEAARLRTYATHRALTELSGNLLRCYQLYFPTPKGLWREIHQLYTLAEHYGILDKTIEDEATRSNLSIKHCYYRTMLLSTARPNQLRQQEIAQLSQAFNEWAQYCELIPSKEAKTPYPFVVDMKSDEGALFYQWHKDSIDSKSTSLCYVKLNKLVDVLRDRIQNINDTEGLELSIKILSPTVLRHLLQSWSASTQRAYARTKTSGDVALAFGLGAVHHYLSGGQDFGKMLMGGHEELLLQDEENPFLKGNNANSNYGFNDELRSGGDVWSLSAVSSASSGKTKSGGDKQAKQANQFRSFSCTMVDTSPGGYCLDWQGQAPASLKTGELITIREDGQKSWSIGVIRWVKKTSSTSMRMGLELLAPHAEALGAKVVRKDGATTEYMRAIRLPELKAIGQPSTLITPQLTFKAGYKVMLNVDGEEFKLQLTKEIGATASFSQFEYKIIGEKFAKATQKDNISSAEDDEFNSLWTSL